MSIKATGAGCRAEVHVGGAVNTNFYPTTTYHYQPETFYESVTHHKSIFFNDATSNIGDATNPANYVYVGSRLRFPDYTASLDIVGASANTTIGNIIGTINVILAGTAGKIAVYAS